MMSGESIILPARGDPPNIVKDFSEIRKNLDPPAALRVADAYESISSTSFCTKEIKSAVFIEPSSFPP